MIQNINTWHIGLYYNGMKYKIQYLYFIYSQMQTSSDQVSDSFINKLYYKYNIMIYLLLGAGEIKWEREKKMFELLNPHIMTIIKILMF